MKSYDPVASSSVSPLRHDAIVAGLGLVSRKELCGLLALLETIGSVELARGAVETVQEKLGKQVAGLSDRLNRRAEMLLVEDTPDDVLRHRLWVGLVHALDARSVLPLSTRSMREASAALAIRAAEVLSPSIHAKRATTAHKASGNPEMAGRAFSGLLKDPLKLFAQKPVLPFPEIVAEEAFRLLDAVKAAGTESGLDPDVAKAVEVARASARNVVAVGGAWTAFAAVVQGAGFAPYILAAQASAFIPFVSGPVAVSFLAVLVNPVTLIAGLVALGYWGVGKQADGLRRIAAAQVAAILAISGMGREDLGICQTVSTFRGLVNQGPKAFVHLAKEDMAAVRRKASGLRSRLLRGLPPAISPDSSVWARSVTHARGFVDPEVPLVGTLTLVDLIYHAAVIDPKIIAAADFSRKMTIDNPVEFAAQLGAFLSDGARTSLRGYTAEQIVLAHFTDAGCAVEVPATSNMPGFDLLIDGSPVQVKCGAGIDLLKEQFQKYPEIPVVANSEMMEQLGRLDPEFRDLVSTIEGFDLSSVQEILDRTVQGAEGLADSDVPVFAMLVGAGKGAYRVWKGEIPVEDLPEWLLVELSVRGALAAGGKIAGGFVGLLAIGPAGAVIAAPLVGVLALLVTGNAKGEAEKVLFREWNAEVLSEARALHTAIHDVLRKRTDALFSRALAFDAVQSGMNADLALLLYRRAIDDAIFAFESADALNAPAGVQDIPELLFALGRLNTPTIATIKGRRRVEAALLRKPTLRARAKEIFEGVRNIAAKKSPKAHKSD